MKGGHGLHCDGLTENVPFGQLRHVARVVAAISGENIPCLHGLHVLAPASSWYVPSIHQLHLPFSSMYVPGGHCMLP